MEENEFLNFSSDYVKPLGLAQNEFIQVLLSSFKLVRDNIGVTLEVDFNDRTPAIWLKSGKSYVGSKLDMTRFDECKDALQSILLANEKSEYIHNNPGFPFRYGNGGTLPVLRFGNKDYYCLFYREINPIGWNIANGGAESVAELLDPLANIEREFREELIIIDPVAKHSYVYDWIEGRRKDHPDFAVSRAFWNEMFREQYGANFPFEELCDIPLPIKWLNGNDKIKIKYKDHPSIEFSDLIININAEDFGIEIDRIAKIAVDSNAILCDGELADGKLLNQIVGLFEVHKFNRYLAAGKTEFKPDLFFWSGRNRSDDKFDDVVNEFMDDVIKRNIINTKLRAIWQTNPNKYDLCPVTKTLIKRFLSMDDSYHQAIEDVQPGKQQTKAEVFLSFASEDVHLAKVVFDYLKNAGYNVFFSEETLHHANFGEAIDEALFAADSMVIVGSETNRFSKPFVKYECQSFVNSIRTGRRPWETPIVTIAQKPVDRNSLPKALLNYQIIEFDQQSFKQSLHKLQNYLSKAL